MTMGSPALVTSSPRKNQTASVRRTNKPLVEKKRRARINGCLGQLKSLLLSAMKTEGTQVSRLEKADILEMTVKYLRHVQTISPSPSTFLPAGTSSPSSSSLVPNAAAAAATTEPEVTAKFSAGYTECATEVIRYMESVTGMTDEIKMRLENHLVGRLHGSVAAPLTPTASTSSSSSSSPSSSSHCVENNSNSSRIEAKPENNKGTNEHFHSNDIVSPRHYQTALDLANMATSIVQQQQQNHYHQHQHHQRPHIETKQEIQTQPEDASQQPMMSSSVTATPDTPPSTPPHIKMETDCFYENSHYNHPNTNRFEDNNNKNDKTNKTYTNSSSSPSSSTSLSPSYPSEDDYELVIDCAEEDGHLVCEEDSLNMKIGTGVFFTSREPHQLYSGKGDSHDNNHPNPRNPSHVVGDNQNQLNCQVNTSPINLIRRRLPLSAYATPLHIDIPGSPALPNSPSPPHLLHSKPGHHSSQINTTNIHNNNKDDIQKPLDIQDDNESLPTILYGVRPETHNQSMAPLTHSNPQRYHHQMQNTPSSHLEPITKTSPANTCNPGNCENNTNCRSQSRSSSSSLENHEPCIQSTRPNHKQKLQTALHSQGHHPYVRIDNHRTVPAPAPSPPTLTRQDTVIKSTPSPHPYLPIPIHTTQKTRHFFGDSHSNHSTSGHDVSSQQPPYVTESRKSPASEFVVDNGKPIDMRNWKRYDRKSDINNVHSNENGNKFEDVNNNNNNICQYTCKNNGWNNTRHFRQPTPAFKQLPIHNQIYQEQYYSHQHNKQMQRKQQQYHHYQQQQQQQFADNLNTKQIYNNAHVESFDHTNNSNPIMRMQTSTNIPQRLLNDNHAHHYQRFSSSINHHHHHHQLPHQSSHPLLPHHQHQNHHRGGQTFSQNQPQILGMRPDSGELSTSTTANSTDSHEPFMNENRTMTTTKLEQCQKYNKTRAISSVAEAAAASRQNRSALLSLALRSETTGTGQVSEVNSYSAHPQHTITHAVTRQKTHEYESRADERNGSGVRGHNPGNYVDHSVTPLLTSLDNIDCGREQVWRPW